MDNKKLIMNNLSSFIPFVMSQVSERYEDHCLFLLISIEAQNIAVIWNIHL